MAIAAVVPQKKTGTIAHRLRQHGPSIQGLTMHWEEADKIGSLSCLHRQIGEPTIDFACRYGRVLRGDRAA